MCQARTEFFASGARAVPPTTTSSGDNDEDNNNNNNDDVVAGSGVCVFYVVNCSTHQANSQLCAACVLGSYTDSLSSLSLSSVCAKVFYPLKLEAKKRSHTCARFIYCNIRLRTDAASTAAATTLQKNRQQRHTHTCAGRSVVCKVSRCPVVRSRTHASYNNIPCSLVCTGYT